MAVPFSYGYYYTVDRVGVAYRSLRRLERAERSGTFRGAGSEAFVGSISGTDCRRAV